MTIEVSTNAQTDRDSPVEVLVTGIGGVYFNTYCGASQP